MFIRRDIYWLLGFSAPQGHWNTRPTSDMSTEIIQVWRVRYAQAQSPQAGPAAIQTRHSTLSDKRTPRILPATDLRN